MAILRAVATIENVEPRSLTPLGDAVDLDALDVLLDEQEGGTRVTFSYAGYRLVVTPDAVEVY